MSVFTQEKAFAFEICFKIFMQENDLERYIRTHTKEKQFSCEICSEEFSESGVLQNYVCMHKKEKKNHL